MADEKPNHRDRPVPPNPQTHKKVEHPSGKFVPGNECDHPDDLPVY